MSSLPHPQLPISRYKKSSFLRLSLQTSKEWADRTPSKWEQLKTLPNLDTRDLVDGRGRAEFLRGIQSCAAFPLELLDVVLNYRACSPVASKSSSLLRLMHPASYYRILLLRARHVTMLNELYEESSVHRRMRHCFIEHLSTLRMWVQAELYHIRRKTRLCITTLIVTKSSFYF